MEDDLKNINKSVEEFFKSYNDSNRKHSHSNLADYLLQKHDYSIVESYIESFVEEQGKINPGFNEISFNEFKKFKNNINLDINVPNDSYLKNYFNIPDDISEIQEQDKETEDLRREAEKEITDPPDDLADGDAMTEQSLQEIEEELGEVDEDAIRKSIDDMPENTLSSIDPNAKAPDTVPEDLIEEVDKKRFEEFMELQGKDTVPFSDADRANTFKDNLIDADDTNTIESFAEIAKNEKLPTYEDVVNQYNQQLDNVVDNMPIEKIAKKKLKDKVLELSTRLLTPGGAMDLVDAYETIVFGLGIMVAAAPELKNIASYYSTLAANHIGKAYGMNIPVDKLEPDWERINKVMDQVEAVTPTDILINKVMDREQKGNTYVSSYLPGFLPQSTIKNDDVSTTLEKTLMNMPINKGKTETSSDKLKESLIYGSTK